MQTVQVRLPAVSYPVMVGRDLLGRARELLAGRIGKHRPIVISDELVWKAHGRALEAGLGGKKQLADVLLVEPGERSKSLAHATRLFSGLLEAGCDRKTTVIAFGGGVVGDLAGFVAATFMRGVPFLQVPTTLLAMVDSSVGGKVAVNHPLGKNVIGVFYQPGAVLADLDTLETLPPSELAAGAVEAVKYGLLGDAELLEHCQRRPFEQWDLERLVAWSVKDKAAVVAVDEKETGPRRRLNLGHTLGHALEAATRYKGYLHGEAVAIGTLYAMRLSVMRGRASEDDFEALYDLYEKIGVPLRLPSTAFSKLLKLMRHDKKATRGKMLFVLPVGIGQIEEAEGLPEEQLEEAYRELRRCFNQ